MKYTSFLDFYRVISIHGVVGGPPPLPTTCSMYSYIYPCLVMQSDSCPWAKMESDFWEDLRNLWNYSDYSLRFRLKFTFCCWTYTFPIVDYCWVPMHKQHWKHFRAYALTTIGRFFDFCRSECLNHWGLDHYRPISCSQRKFFLLRTMYLYLSAYKLSGYVVLPFRYTVM